MTDPRLGQLAALAALRSAKSAARLAPLQAQVDALRGQAAAIRDAPREDVRDVRHAMVQDRHDSWRAEQLRRLATDIARAEAQAQPLREAQARDLAREAVLDRLRGKR